MVERRIRHGLLGKHLVTSDKRAAIESIPTACEEIVVVCRKCSKKLHGGFGPDGKLALCRALKAELRRSGGRQAVRVVETKCLNPCPKRAVAVIFADRPGTMLSVPAGADPAAVLARPPPA